jgi:hypothetical protein
MQGEKKLPSKNLAQHHLMQMIAHNPQAAKRLGIPQSVGQEFVQADKGKKFANALREHGKKQVNID